MNQVLDVQIFRPGAGPLSKGTGTLHLTSHHLIYTYDAIGKADSGEKQKSEQMWVGKLYLNA